MTKPIDPIFAPIPYGDDRQITRTRRGLHCPEEMQYNPSIVYCKCHSCLYEWQIPKKEYDIGIIGQGGTGNHEDNGPFSYGKYTERLLDCCTGGMGLCGEENDYVPVGTIYPYVYTTDELGNEQRELGDPEEVYVLCQGGSGTNAPKVTPNNYGSQPLACPNCCKVNFEAKWIIPDDNGGLVEGSYCTAIIVIDFQRIKSDFIVNF